MVMNTIIVRKLDKYSCRVENETRKRTTPSSEKMTAEWSELPPEIVETISIKLTIYSDYIRFRSVCRNWLSSVPKTPLHLPPQLPCLILSHQSFFNISTEKTHLFNLPLPSSSFSLRTRICGSSHGWLIIIDETPHIRLFNPVTCVTLFLPPNHTFPNVISFNSSDIGREYLVTNPNSGFCYLNLRQMCKTFVRKIVLSWSPTKSDDFTAFAIVGLNNLAFCKKGYDSWILLTNEVYFWEDAVYHNGLFYAVSKEGMIAVCDVDVRRVSIFGPMPPIQFGGDIHYAVFSGEDLLLVTRDLEQEFSDMVDECYNYMSMYRTVGFMVFKMDWNVMAWRRIETLCDKALFIGANSSMCFSAADFVGCRADCIYFTDDYSDSNHDDAVAKHDFGIFRLSDESIEPLPCYPRNSYPRFGWPFGPFPIWISPNPC
ncbi:F-box protein At2g26160-like [Cicer arietinum]|uniref:F-box protein At2g26160-like isoform X2 n=1 Tax=Cicer arietinum TaxID=3827 RepID=A0A3Q7YBY3_CICAR|nr:F-box protein At2g26160-like isoform X2 [Cicer arietinum]